VVRIDQHIAKWESCYVFWLESCIGRERPDHAKFSSQFAARFARSMSMQLNAPNAGDFGEFANFGSIRIDENTNGAGSCRESVHNSADDHWLDVARANPVKVKPNHVHTEFDARVRIIRSRNTADFDLCVSHHGKSQTGGRLVGRVTP
jgi:hypothetical protein